MSVARVGLGSGLGLSVRMISCMIDDLLIDLFISNSQDRTTSIYIISRITPNYVGSEPSWSNGLEPPKSGIPH